MKTLSLFQANLPLIPSISAWYISSIMESKGKQILFSYQSPQKLKALREHALIQSAVSSNRIEGVTIDASRINTVILGKPLYRDRNEEEIGGYRECLNLIHSSGKSLKVNESNILDFHRHTKGELWDSGKYKEKDGSIIETYSDGSSRVRFETVAAAQTQGYMNQLLELWYTMSIDTNIPFLVLLAAFNLDFLCIHPFRDGNGRVSRLLLLLQAYHGDFEVGRYISLERIIEENKERYYETLEQSSKNWHEGQHDPWPYIQFILYVFKIAYKEFEDRIEQIGSVKGEMSQLILNVIDKLPTQFSMKDVQTACPGVSIDLIRFVLKELKDSRNIECISRGRTALWKKCDNYSN